MDNAIYIIFRDGIPHELIRGDAEYRTMRVDAWNEMFPEFHHTISFIGLDLLDQYEY